MREVMRSANLLENRLGLAYNETAWGAKPFGGDPMQKLAIFYSPPIAVVGSDFYPERAAEIFARYDVVVFPGQVPLAGITGIENPSNAFYTSSKQVLDAIRLINPNTLVYGYIPMDIPYSNLTLSQIQASVTQCRDFGYDGIFWDTCGSEFGNTRARQNACVGYAHAATNSRRPGGMLSILNGFDPYDIYNSAVNTNLIYTNNPPTVQEQINPTGAAPLVYTGDGILAESFAVNTDPSAAPYGWANGWQNIVTLFNKQYHFSVFRLSLGIKVFAISVLPPTTLTPYTTKDALEYANFAQAMAYLFAVDFFGYGTQNYGGADQIIPVFPTITPFGQTDYYAVQPFWTTIFQTLSSTGTIIKGRYRRQLYGTGVNHFIEVELDDTVTPTSRKFWYLDSDGVSLYGGVSAASPPGSSVGMYKPGNNYGAAHDLVRHVYLSGYDKAARSAVDMSLPTAYTVPVSHIWLCEYNSGGTKIFEYGLPILVVPSKPTPTLNVEVDVTPGGSEAFYAGDFGNPAQDFVLELQGEMWSGSAGTAPTVLAHIEQFALLGAALARTNRVEYRTDGEVFWRPVVTDTPKRGDLKRVNHPTPWKSGVMLGLFTSKTRWLRTSTATYYDIVF